MDRSRLHLVLAAAAIGVTASTCGGASSTVPVVSRPTTTAAAPVVAVVDEAFLAEQADRVSIPESGGALMVAVVGADGEVVFTARGTDPKGNAPRPDSAFRIGSITEVFTATAVLSLVDEGLVDLDTPAVEYVTRVPVPADVTVRHLLQHTSGIPDYTDSHDMGPGLANLWSPRWGQGWLADPDRTWTPEEIVELIAGREHLFEPGESPWIWSYSNINYVVLGVLIEETTGRTLAEDLRARIIEPLGMESTYLAGFDVGPDPLGAYVTMSDDERAEPIDFDYTSLATSAWASGGMVSTAQDLHALFTGLFDGQLISAGSLAQMTGNLRGPFWSDMEIQFDYGLGVLVPHRFAGGRVEGLVGHVGFMPGYGTLVAHAPDTGITAFWVTTNDELDPKRTYAAVAERITRPFEDLGELTDPVVVGDATITIYQGTPALNRLVAWGLGRFEAAGLAPPTIASVTFTLFSNDCEDVRALYRAAPEGATLIFCFGEGLACQDDACDDFTPAGRSEMLHELAHAWMHTSLDDSIERRFLDHVGLATWNDPTTAWERRGVEHAAETIAWGLMDCDVRMLRIGNPGPEDLATGFRILTDIDPLPKTQ